MSVILACLVVINVLMAQLVKFVEMGTIEMIIKPAIYAQLVVLFAILTVHIICPNALNVTLPISY
jgi:hypothetical protein